MGSARCAVAQAIANSAPNAVSGMTLLRELIDGFQCHEVKDGKTECPHCPESCGTVHEWFAPEDEDQTFRAIDMLDEVLVSRLEKREVDCPRCGGSGEVDRMKRIVREVPCPKTKALKALLEENEEVGRIVIFAGFTGSVDRVTGICRKEGWDVVRCDGRGFQVTTHHGEISTNVDPLDYWADLEEKPRVAFVAHPESGGMSLTLVEARTAVYWSNSFKPEYRAQSEDRIRRKGMDENLGCTIVDLIHLPTDERVLEVIRDNRRLELMTMGDFTDALSEHEQIKSLRDEIALARMLIEERFNKVRNDSDLIAAFGPINTALLTVERLVKSAHTIEQNLGALLSKPTVLALGQSISQIIVEELEGIDDYEAIVDRINHRIVEAIVAAGTTSAN